MTQQREIAREGIRKRWALVKHFFVDKACGCLKLMDKASHLDFVIGDIRRSDVQHGFKVLPRRWVAERTFGWMIRSRSFVRDSGKRIAVAHVIILVAMGRK